MILLASCSGNSNNTNVAGADSISKHSSQVYVPAKIFHITGDVQTILKEIVSHKNFEYNSIGIGGSPSEQYARYEAILSKVNDSELVALTDYPNPAVRCYAFYGLVQHKYKTLLPILIHHLTDTAQVPVFSGCTLFSEMTGDFFCLTAEPDPKENMGITDAEQKKLDSIMVYRDDVYLMASGALIEEAAPLEKNYKRFRLLVTRDHDGSALWALSRYKKPEDVALIRNFISNKKTEYSGVLAATQFPDASFYPFIVEIFERNWKQPLYDYGMWRALYNALANYPCDKTMELFNRTVSVTDDFKYSTLSSDLLVAITKYPAPLFESLKGKIHLNDSELDQVKDVLKSDNTYGALKSF